MLILDTGVVFSMVQAGSVINCTEGDQKYFTDYKWCCTNDCEIIHTISHRNLGSKMLSKADFHVILMCYVTSFACFNIYSHEITIDYNQCVFDSVYL